MHGESREYCEFLNERFEVYFFLYFIGYVLVWRLNDEYISAKFMHEVMMDGNSEYSHINISTVDESGLLLPKDPLDVGHYYCLNDTFTPNDMQPLEVTMDLMQGVERNMLTVYSAILIPSIFVTILFGLISDFTGKRKFMMSTSSFSNALYALVIVLDYYIGHDTGVRNLIIGAVVAGLFGNWAATTVALITYVADVTDLKQRFFRVSVVILLMKIADAAFEGPLLYWIKSSGFQQPIWFTFAASSLACSIIVQIMDESQATNRDYRPFNLGHFHYWIRTVKIKAIFDKYFVFLLVSYSCLVFISEGYYTWVVYSTFSLIVCSSYNVPFGYLHFIAYSLFSCVGLVLSLLPPARKIPDIVLALVGIVSTAAGLVFLPFCTNEWMFYTGYAVMFLQMLPYAAYLTLSSKHTVTEKQAIALTFLYCSGGISKLLALVFNFTVLHYVNGSNRGAIMIWVHAGLLLVPAGFLLVLWLKQRAVSDYGSKTDIENKQS